MSYILPLVVAICFNTADKILARKALRARSDPDAYLMTYQLVCLAISLPAAAVALAGGNAVSPQVSERTVLTVVLAASSMLAWAVFAISTFRSAARLEVSISATISRTKLIWAAILGVLLFGESLEPVHIAGLLVIFFANLSLRAITIDLLDPKGIAYALTAAAGLSLAFALDKWLLGLFDPSVVLFIGFAGGSIASLYLNRGSSVTAFRSVLPSASAAAVCGCAGYYFLLVAMESGPLNVIVPVYQSAHIVHVLAGMLFLREVDALAAKLFSAGVSTLGIVMIFVGSSAF